MAQERRGSVPVFTVDQICNIQNVIGSSAKGKTVVALVYVHASWTSFPSDEHPLNHSVLKSLLQQADARTEVLSVVGSISLDQSDDSMACAVGDDDYTLAHNNEDMPIPPAQLPVLALSIQTPAREHARVRYLTDISPFELMRYIRHHNNPQSAKVRSSWSKIIQTELLQVLAESPRSNKKRALEAVSQDAIEPTLPTVNQEKDDGQGAIRIFIAGDKSSVGKSSVCLGIMANLVQKFGYSPSQLAYIKPATQCEAPQLIQKYCESVGIDCVAVGPLVYYKGFTRAFLAGETGQTTDDLLRGCGQAVDAIARSKKIVLVDGVGFPAVGSICGTDNASVSIACGYPVGCNASIKRHPLGVVLVGGSGVGGAVDSFNLNATYFEMAQVPVMGGIFNKLSTEGYYSLENCRTQLTSYFGQNEHQKKLGRQPFGFVPLFDGITGDDALQQMDGFIKVFGDHVNIQAILESAKRIKQSANTTEDTTADMEIDPPTAQPNSHVPPKKRFKAEASPNGKARRRTGSVGSNYRGMSRKEIEQLAAQQGAAAKA